MNINANEHLICSKCKSNNFEMKRETTYLYTYDINPSKLLSEVDETKTTPFLFDNREQINEKEYFVCKDCGATYPCHIDKNNNKICLTILQKALRSDFQGEPEFKG